MVNIVKFGLATLGFLAVSFLLKNFVLGKEFDVVSSVIDMIIVVVSLWVGGMLVQKVTGQDAKLVNL